MGHRPEDIEAIYRAVPLFKELTAEELEVILDMSRLLRAGPGTVLVREGERGTGMYVLVRGSARVTVSQEDVEDTTLALLERGDTVGELNLIDDSPHSATVTCLEASMVFHTDTRAFNVLRRRGHPAAFKILRAMAPMICERLRLINERERSMRLIERAYLQKAALDRLR